MTNLTELGVHLPSGWEHVTVWISAVLTTAVSLFHILSHLRQYNKPSEQRLIVRVASVIPIYALTSAIAFSAPSYSLVLAAIRDIAEAMVIYSFLTLLYSYLGGEGQICNALNGTPISGSLATWTCCLTGRPFSGQILRFSKQCALQFCIIRPVVSTLEVFMYRFGVYPLEAPYQLHSAPLFVTLVYNVSISFALYGLALFYICTKKLLEPHNPVMKFVSVKGIILVCYWQNLLIAILAQAGSIETPGSLQGVLTALECLPAAILVLRAFPVEPYAKEAVDASPLDPMTGKDFKQIFVSVQDTVNPRDIFQDVVHNFSSRYRGYAQYHNVQVSEGLAENDSRLMDSDDEPVGVGM